MDFYVHQLSLNFILTEIKFFNYGSEPAGKRVRLTEISRTYLSNGPLPFCLLPLPVGTGGVQSVLDLPLCLQPHRPASSRRCPPSVQMRRPPERSPYRTKGAMLELLTFSLGRLAAAWRDMRSVFSLESGLSNIHGSASGFKSPAGRVNRKLCLPSAPLSALISNLLAILIQSTELESE